MNSLMPILKTPYSLGTHNSKASQVKPFLFRTTHGRANLGFILNGYGFISPEEIEQAEIPQLDMGFEYKWEFLKNTNGIYTGLEIRDRYFEERIFRNLSSFKLIYTQSQKPIPKKELELKQNIPQITKLKLKHDVEGRIYTCKLKIIRNISLEYLTEKEYKSEIYRKVLFEFKKIFSQQRLNPFESLDLLTQGINPNLRFNPDFSKVDSFYGSIHEFTPNNQNPKPKALSSVLIFR